MSLIRYFLPNEDQNPANIKYLHSLLALPISRLVKEKESLSLRSEFLESQIKSHAVTESKEFVQALGNTKNLLKLKSGLLDSLHKCKEETIKFKNIIETQTQEIDKIVKEQQKIENLNNMQGIITEIFEIPGLLKNLINSKHYREAISLIQYIEKIESNEKIFKEIKENGQNARIKLEEDLVDVISENFETDKNRELMEHLKNLKKLEKNNEIQEFFECKKMGFRKILKKYATPKNSPLVLFTHILDFLLKLEQVVKELFVNYEDNLTSFFIDIIRIVLNLFEEYFPNSVSDLYDLSQKLIEINTQMFLPYSCNVYPEISSLVTQKLAQKIEFYYKKTLINFENLLKMYGWESSGNKENPILEFGSLSVLFNNIITIINEVR